MKTYNKICDELKANGGILKDYSMRTFYHKPGYVNHRVDGPACEWSDGDKTWYYNGKWIMETQGDATPEQLLDFKLRIL